MAIRSIVPGICLMLFAGSAALSHYGYGAPIADDETGRPLGPVMIAVIIASVGGAGLLSVVRELLRGRRGAAP